GIYCDIPENLQHSHDELITRLSDFFCDDRHRYELMGEILTRGDTIAFQYQICPFDEARRNGSTNSCCGAEFMTLHGDAAMTITDFYDTPGMAQTSKSQFQAPREAQRQKYAKSGLSSEQLDEYKQRLEEIMRSQQAFLKSDLTLPKLAEAIHCSVNHLSQVINSSWECCKFSGMSQ
ncbi:MAG: hypothetical protein O7E57_15290, partial [Gammaproteobacteria bacterium]|nr:hypothetical protein [Gammaproteobacteria bacterium]